MSRSVEETRLELERERAHLVAAAEALRAETSQRFDLRARLGGHPVLVASGALLGGFVAVGLVLAAIRGMLRLAGRALQAALP